MKVLSKILAFTLFAFLYFSSCKKDPPAEVPVQSAILITNLSSWSLASVPLKFAESNLNNNIAYGYNRAKIAWYKIDPSIFYDKNLSKIPSNITKDDVSADDCRVIYDVELFPSKPNQYNQPLNMDVFNIDYYPSEKGPWNYDTQPSTFSAGIAYDGNLNEPATRWGGILRKIEITDRKINFLDFWILDPFSSFPDANGELIFDIGQISEDVLKDGLLSDESTVEGQSISTVWGLVKPLSDYSSFPPDPDRTKYDTGLDGLQSNIDNFYYVDENSYFKDYLLDVGLICDPSVYSSIASDPANDNFHSFLGKDLDNLNYKVHARYKKFNGYENNSPIDDGGDIATIGQRNPNTEDINRNRILDTLNNYCEYKMRINKDLLQVGSNYLTEIFTNPNPTKLQNGSITYSKFYHFRIPLNDYNNMYGTPDLSSNPEFIRLYFTGFTSPVGLRFINMMFTEDIFIYTN